MLRGELGLHEVEGKINEVAGKVVGDKKLEVKGKVQQIGGEAQAKLGDVKQELKDSSKKGACLFHPRVLARNVSSRGMRLRGPGEYRCHYLLCGDPDFDQLPS
jgi:uncharacterized protein YjbJ (UPF0337 family)